MKKRALVLGASGMDGSHLAELLLLKGYEVHGLYRRTSTGSFRWLEPCLPAITMHQGDILDQVSLKRVISHVQPTELYNNADQDQIDWTFGQPLYTFDVTARAVVSLLEVVREVNPAIRVYQPVSALMFGDSVPAQSETSPLNPLSPYAVAKSAAFLACKYYRRCHGLFVSTGILYSHISERRNEEYLLTKVCKAARRITQGLQHEIVVGELCQRVDIGYAPEFVEASWRVLQNDSPDDYIIGTGYCWSIREIISEVFRQVGLGPNIDQYVRESPQFVRPGPPCAYIANPSKIKRVLGWQSKTKMEDLISHFLEAQPEQ